MRRRLGGRDSPWFPTSPRRSAPSLLHDDPPPGIPSPAGPGTSHGDPTDLADHARYRKPVELIGQQPLARIGESQRLAGKLVRRETSELLVGPGDRGKTPA